MWITPTSELAARFAARVVRLAKYRRSLAAIGLVSLTLLGWAALVDAAVCRLVYNPSTRTYTRICR